MLVTNDYPPKIGGIQTYLWELWRRMPAQAVVTGSHPQAKEFDSRQPNEIVRLSQKVLLPTSGVRRKVKEQLADHRELVFVDPVLPLGLIAPKLDTAYACIVHGAELTVPSRTIPTLARRVLSGAEFAVCAGNYPQRIVNNISPGLPTVCVPPGVDTDAFRPLDAYAIAETRKRFGLDPARPLVLSVSRLVPRKGFDVLIDAIARLDDSVVCAIVGTGRDKVRLMARAKRRGITERIRFLGSVTSGDLSLLYGSADVFAMLCRDRWAGLEAEGFGIVFLEAAACGVPSVVGRSGGASDSVEDGETGFVVEPHRVEEVTARLSLLLGDEELRQTFGKKARERAQREFDYDELAGRITSAAEDFVA